MVSKFRRSSQAWKKRLKHCIQIVHFSQHFFIANFFSFHLVCNKKIKCKQKEMLSQIQLYQAVKKIMEGEYGAKDNQMCINSEAKLLSAPCEH